MRRKQLSEKTMGQLRQVFLERAQGSVRRFAMATSTQCAARVGLGWKKHRDVPSIFVAVVRLSRGGRGGGLCKLPR